MNNWPWEATASVAVAVLSGIFTNAFFYGRLTQRVSNNSDDIRDLKREQGLSRNVLQDHGQRIGRLEGQMKGRGAGA